MLSISLMSGAGQGAYYTSLAREDYYLEGGEPPGQWWGDSAEKLGLNGVVETEAFRNLLLGFSHNGQERLVQNAGEDSHQSGWDLTFSAPKSVSVHWSQAESDVRKEIQAAQDAAVKAALAYLQDETGYTRRGAQGMRVEQVGFIAALFEHSTSRAQDPQLHTHVLVLNIGVRSDGTTGTLKTVDLYRHKMAAGALYRAELAAQLQKRLGVGIRQEQRGFEIEGVSKNLMEIFSKRRAQIEEDLAKSGHSGAVASKIAALNTRLTKESISREKLFAEWQAVGQAHGWSRSEAQALLRRGQRQQYVDRSQLVRSAIQWITGQQSFFSERELVRRVAEASTPFGLSVKEILEAVRAGLKSSDIVALSLVKGEQCYTTKEMLALEKALLATAISVRDARAHQISERTLNKLPKKGLSDEQREAVRHLTLGRGQVSIVTGMAGTGKSTMLSAARQLWEAEGFSVKGAALSGKAARGLTESAGIQSNTIAKLLMDLARGRTVLDSKTILVVDEAGMVGTRQMKSVLDACIKAGAKLGLVGDAGQLQPIEAGGPFPALAKALGEAKLTKIHRQGEEWAKSAVHQFAAGEASMALSTYAERGLVSVEKTRLEAQKRLIETWTLKGVSRPGEHLILTSDNAEARELNRLAQDERLRARQLGGPSVRVGTNSFHAGDRVLFTRNSRLYGVDNGALGTVTALFPQLLIVRLDDKRTVRIPVNKYDHLRLGYAVTTHKAQGMTAEHAYILAGGSMTDRELAYVQASRARIETRFFVDEANAGPKLSGLARAMENSRAKELAITHTRETPLLSRQAERHDQALGFEHLH